MNHSFHRFLPGPPLAALALMTGPLIAADASPTGLRVVETAARIEIHAGGQVVFGWQRAPIGEPKGGDKFAASAFIHPLATPSGFGMTEIQPSDHLHHFGVWWPWKHVEVDGKKFNCWELQNGEGRQTAATAEVVDSPEGEITLRLGNRHQIKAGETYQPVILEETTLTFSSLGADAYQLDIDISHRPAEGVEPLIPAYRYSGFSWRGPAAWDRDNSRMRTSGGHDRDNANHQPAHWLMVDGETPAGRATMLMMSAAPMHGGEPELLRVWGSKQHNGAPFVNFNPVAKKSRPPADPAVARRKYRLVLADREISLEEANNLWRQWQNE